MSFENVFQVYQLDVHDESLYELTSYYLCGHVDTLDEDGFLLRRLGDNLLPSQRLWLVQGDATNAGNVGFSGAVGKGSSQGRGKGRGAKRISDLTKLDRNTVLKKLYLTNAESLAVELLPQGQSTAIKRPGGAFYVWVTRLMNPSDSEVC